MRVMLATFGVLCIPLAWYTAKELRFSNLACHMVTIMVLCGMPFRDQRQEGTLRRLFRPGMADHLTIYSP